MKPLNDYKNANMVFNDILGSTNSRHLHQFFMRGRHMKLDTNCLSQSYFDLPKTTIRNNSSKIVLCSQTFKDIENIYKEVGWCDMSYDEFKQLCRKYRE